RAFPAPPPDPRDLRAATGAVETGAAWVEAHERLLLGAAADAGRRGWWSVATGIVVTMANYVPMRPYSTDWETTGAELLAGIDPAHPARDDVLLALGMQAQARGRFDEALPMLRRARRGYVAAKDADRAAIAAAQYGVIHRRRGRLRLATAIHEWVVARLSPDLFPAQLGRALLGRGNYILESYGDLEAGYALLERALEYARAGGDLDAESNILGTMGLMMRREGRPDRARELFEQALAIGRRTGSHTTASILSSYLTRALLDLGELAQAQETAAAALATARESQHQMLAREAYSVSAQAAYARRDLVSAAEHALEAVRIGRQTGVLGLGGSLFTLAKIRLAEGDEAAAVAHAQEAREIYARLNRPEADLIAAWLGSWTQE
ncbi:MAG: tetratricopeptide repeat protein, partial [Hamadaea sp.]|nr:tetratricopeptide repeat protein [Hamadaea sp.]